MRYSGTEPLLRIMLEGRDQAEIPAWAEEIADAVRTSPGVSLASVAAAGDGRVIRFPDRP